MHFQRFKKPKYIKKICLDFAILFSFSLFSNVALLLFPDRMKQAQFGLPVFFFSRDQTANFQLFHKASLPKSRTETMYTPEFLRCSHLLTFHGSWRNEIRLEHLPVLRNAT